jgi:hypothetical protein
VIVRRLVAALTGLALTGSALQAVAHPRDSAAAEALFEEARRLADAGKYAEACPKFAESNRLDPGVGVLMYLGACYERLGRVASAWAAFREAREGAATQGRADRVTTAEERIRALEPRLPRLRIDVPVDANISGLAIARDELPVNEATWGTPIPVDPGNHVVTATAPGYEPWETQVEAKEGQLAALEVPPLRLVRASAAPAGAAGPTGAPSGGANDGAPSDTGSGQRTAAVIVMGVGGASLVAGTIFGIVASSHWSSAQEECSAGEPLRCSQTGLDSIDASETTGLASTIFFVVGGAAAAGGAVLWFTAPTGNTSSASIGLQPGGVRARGTF